MFPTSFRRTWSAQGFFTFDDLWIIEQHLAELGGGLTTDQCDEIIAFADEEALRLEEQTANWRSNSGKSVGWRRRKRRVTNILVGGSPLSRFLRNRRRRKGELLQNRKPLRRTEPAKSEGEPPVEDHSVEVGSEAQAAEVQGESQAE